MNMAPSKTSSPKHGDLKGSPHAPFWTPKPTGRILHRVSARIPRRAWTAPARFDEVCRVDERIDAAFDEQMSIEAGEQSTASRSTAYEKVSEKGVNDQLGRSLKM